MFVVFFIAGMIVSGSLAYKGLVTGSLQFSKSTALTGGKAKTAGFFCLGIMLILLAATVWAAWSLLTPR
jgi:hypothetical protein